MTPPKAWWNGDPRERFWLESTDRPDLGVDLRAPLADDSGADNWRYTLFRQANVGDLVFHYDKRRAAITSLSRIAGPPTASPIVWAARGSYARERGAEPAELAGYRMLLDQHRSLTEPLTLEALRGASSSVRTLHDRLTARVGRPLYFPFELSGRPLRPLQGYAFKLPADFVEAFAVLQEAVGLVSMVPPTLAEGAPGDTFDQTSSAIAAAPWRYSAQPKPTGNALAQALPSSRLAYMVHLLDVLRASGGSLRSVEVFERLKAGGYARATDVELTQASGETRFAKEVRFARLELVEAGLVQHSEDGIWSLSDEGWATFLTIKEARTLVSRRRHGGGVRPFKPPRQGPTTGPVPTAFVATVVRSLDRESWTYVLRYGESDLWKIGHTQDVAARLVDVNRHLPIEVTGVDWRLHARLMWPDSAAAYAMEQRLFRTLSRHRTHGERVRCSTLDLGAAWMACALG